MGWQQQGSKAVQQSVNHKQEQGRVCRWQRAVPSFRFEVQLVCRSCLKFRIPLSVLPSLLPSPTHRHS
jgi:hypothetical protein